MSETNSFSCTYELVDDEICQTKLEESKGKNGQIKLNDVVEAGFLEHDLLLAVQIGLSGLHKVDVGLFDFESFG